MPWFYAVTLEIKKVIFSFNSQTQALLEERGHVKVTDVCYIMDPSAHDEA